MHGRYRRFGLPALGIFAFVLLTRTGMHVHNKDDATIIGMTLIFLGLACAAATLFVILRR